MWPNSRTNKDERAVERKNAAGRLHGIFSDARRIRNDRGDSLSYWKEVFELSEDNYTELASKVLQYHQLMRSEIKQVSRQMSETHIPDALYLPHMNELDASISIALSSPAYQSAAGTKADNLLCLQYCSHLTAEDCSVVSAEDIEPILEEIAELRARLQTSNLPDEKVALINSYLSMIETSLQQSQIIGSKAIKKGIRDVIYEVSDHAEDLASDNSEEITAFKGILKGYASAAKEIIKADELLTGLINFASRGSNLLGHIADTLT